MNEMHDQSARQAWSALADGEADAEMAAALSARWREDAQARACWHRYQLIGDVLRSDELAGRGADAEFLQRLRARLDQEPVILAPAAVQAATRQRPTRSGVRRWAPPVAVAAGFLAVAGVLTVTRMSAPPSAAPQLAQAPAALPASAELPAAPVTPVLAVADDRPEPVERGTGSLIRDARLDQYLAAHKQFGSSSALGASSGFLRSAAYEGPNTAGAR